MPSRIRQFVLVAVSLVLANVFTFAASAQSVESIKPQEVSSRPPKIFQPVTKDLVGPLVVEPQHKSEATFPAECTTCSEPLCGCLSGLSLGVRNWLSWGESESRFSGPGPAGFASPLSELKWRNLVSETVEIGASALYWDRLLLMGSFGTGVISSGQLEDNDFALNDSQGLFSRSISPTLNTNMHYFNADLGWRVSESTCGPKCFFDVLIGYQYWRERYLAIGGTLAVSPEVESLPPGLLIGEKYTWQGLRVGAQGGIQISPCCAFKSQVVILPVTRFENHDVHYLRGLTAVERGTGGFGVMADFKLTWCPWKGFFAEAGYRIWDLESGSGRLTEQLNNGKTFSNDSSTAQLPFNSASTLRQGLLLSVGYQW